MERDATSAQAQRVIGLIDLTDLDDAHRPDGLDQLVELALAHGVPAVCVWPEYVERVGVALGAGCRVATVIDFPEGTGDLVAAVDDTRVALANGADEIDLVLAYRAVAAGDDAGAQACVRAVAEVVHESGARLKVILETGELVDRALIVHAAQLAVDAGADFLKTSTGKTPTSATLDAIDAMIDVVLGADRTVGLKPSGGIRTLADAVGYLDLVDRRLGPGWATAETFRFGASGLLADAVAALNATR